MVSISLKEAQRLTLASQKLTGPELSPQKIIEHLGYIQIDTISVVERAHHHVFWSRNNKYMPSDLDQLVKKRKVFEYWSHAASFLPMKDYRYSLPMKRAFKENKTAWFPRDAKLMSAALKRIQNEGPLRSKDFENTKRGATGWWEWKPAKKALERLFLEGKLEVTERRGFQKVYDIPQRVIPESVDISMPTESEYLRFFIHRTLRHHGLATLDEIAYLKKKDFKSKVHSVIKKMCTNGELTEVKVENSLKTYFARPKTLAQQPKINSKIMILSPFDNLVIQRQKLKDLFNYDYQIECYLPAKKRKYGYFCLPVFNGHQPVARLDCKVNRSEKILFVKSINYEKKVDPETLQSKLKKKLNSFAEFNGCHQVQINL